MAQITRAAEIAKIKYPKDQGWRQCWIFFAEECIECKKNECETRRSSKFIGGHIIQWGPKSCQRYEIGTGRERHFDYWKEWMKETLSNHPDFKIEKSELEKYLLIKERPYSKLPPQISSRA